jgi:hypothetical protein
MAAPTLSTEAAASNGHPSGRFNNRERQLCKSVKDHTDALLSHKIVAAGNFTTAGGDANEAITVSGALSTDVALVVLKTAGATPRTLTTCAAATDAINLVFNGDPSTDHVVSYLLLRANS